jgi:GntR family transcriptional regulator
VVKEVRQEIRAIGVPARIARQLMTETDGHALEITRHYVDENGIVFEATVSVFPAERFTYSLQLRRHD